MHGLAAMRAKIAVRSSGTQTLPTPETTPTVTPESALKPLDPAPDDPVGVDDGGGWGCATPDSDGSSSLPWGYVPSPRPDQASRAPSPSPPPVPASKPLPAPQPPSPSSPGPRSALGTSKGNDDTSLPRPPHEPRTRAPWDPIAGFTTRSVLSLVRPPRLGRARFVPPSTPMQYVRPSRPRHVSRSLRPRRRIHGPITLQRLPRWIGCVGPKNGTGQRSRPP